MSDQPTEINEEIVQFQVLESGAKIYVYVLLENGTLWYRGLAWSAWIQVK